PSGSGVGPPTSGAVHPACPAPQLRAQTADGGWLRAARQVRFTRPRLGDLGLCAQLRARITQPGPDRLQWASDLIWRITGSEGGRPLTFSCASKHPSVVCVVRSCSSKAGLGDTLSKNLERLDPRARTGNKRGLSEPPQGGEFRSAGPGARGSGAFSKGYPPGLPCSDAPRTSNKTRPIRCWAFAGRVQGRPRQARFTRPRLGDLGLCAQLRARITQPGPDRLQ